MRLRAGSMLTAEVRLVQPLKAGAMGSLWIGEHLGLGTRVAVKFMSEQAARTDPGALARFRREATAATQIQSQHVVQMIDHGTTEDRTPFIVMQLLDGESLGERIERQRELSVRDTAVILLQVAKALEQAHALGIVHRDLKPDNIFLVRTERPEELFVKVLDFGVAKQRHVGDDSMVTATGVMVGTPAYMSPEQVLGSKDVDYRADLWALGVLAYHAVTGRIPFDGPSPHALLLAICNGEFTPPSRLDKGLTPSLDRWFARALRPNPQDRFGSAREMADAFVEAATEIHWTAAEEATLLIAIPEVPAAPRLPDLDKTVPVGDMIEASSKLAGEERTALLEGFAALADGIRIGSVDDEDTAEKPVAPGLRAAASGTRPAAGQAGAGPPAAVLTQAQLAAGGGAGAGEVARASDRARGARRLRVVVGGAVGILALGAVAAAVLPGAGSGAGYRVPAASSPAPKTTPPRRETEPEDEEGLAEPEPAPPPSAAPGTGFVTVLCTPPCDRVLDGERDLGPSPLFNLALSPGEHALRFERRGTAAKERSVHVAPGRVETVHAAMTEGGTVTSRSLLAPPSAAPVPPRTPTAPSSRPGTAPRAPGPPPPGSGAPR
ncbi:MAG: protein kinase [Deltaproteobacteria bacterium]|nr:protein kinase [Deltaproteobacteria bacterium]